MSQASDDIIPNVYPMRIEQGPEERANLYAGHQYPVTPNLSVSKVIPSVTGNQGMGPYGYPAHVSASIPQVVNVDQVAPTEVPAGEWYMKIKATPIPDNKSITLDKNRIGGRPNGDLATVHIVPDQLLTGRRSAVAEDPDVLHISADNKMSRNIRSLPATTALSEVGYECLTSGSEGSVASSIYNYNAGCCGAGEKSLSSLSSIKSLRVSSKYAEEAIKSRDKVVCDANGGYLGQTNSDGTIVELEDGSVWGKTEHSYVGPGGLKLDISIEAEHPESMVPMKRSTDKTFPMVYTWIAPEISDTPSMDSVQYEYNSDCDGPISEDVSENGTCVSRSWRRSITDWMSGYGGERPGPAETDINIPENDVAVPCPEIVYGGTEFQPPQYAGRKIPMAYRLHAIEVHQFISMDIGLQSEGSEQRTHPWFWDQGIIPSERPMFGSTATPFDPSVTGQLAPVIHNRPIVPMTCPLLNSLHNDELPN